MIFLAILKWFLIINLAALVMFGLILVYDRIRYGVWAAEYPEDRGDGDH